MLLAKQDYVTYIYLRNTQQMKYATDNFVQLYDVDKSALRNVLVNIHGICRNVKMSF